MLMNPEGFYRRRYTNIAEKHGYLPEWVEERVQERLKRYAEILAKREDREYREFPGKAEWLAKNIWDLVAGTTARFDDLPEKSPLQSVSDFEWQQAMALIQKKREGIAASRVDRFVFLNVAKEAHSDLTYILRYHEYAPFERLAYYVDNLRKAQRNYTAIADGMEAERIRMKNQQANERDA